MIIHRAAPALLVLTLLTRVASSDPLDLRLDISFDLHRRVHAELTRVRDTGSSLLLGAECADLEGVEPTPFRLLLDGREARFPVQDTDLEKGRLRLRRRCKHGIPSVGESTKILTAPLDEGRHKIRVIYQVLLGQRCGEGMTADGPAKTPCWIGKLSSAELEMPAADLSLELRAPPGARVDRSIPLQVIFRSRSDIAIPLDGGSIQVVDDRAAGAEEVDYQICKLRPLRLSPRQSETIHCQLDFAEGHDNGGVHRLRARYIDGREPSRRWAESAPVLVRLGAAADQRAAPGGAALPRRASSPSDERRLRLAPLGKLE